MGWLRETTPGLSEDIDVSCRNHALRIAFTNYGTLGNALTKVKTPTPPFEKMGSGAIYAVYCECGGTYIGETGRTFKIRMRGHNGAIKNGDQNNAISVHVHSKGLGVEQHWRRLRIKEAILIRSTPSTRILEYTSTIPGTLSYHHSPNLYHDCQTLLFSVPSLFTLSYICTVTIHL